MAEMKVAYIIESMFNSGGMERVLSVCANALCQKLDISIITLCQKESPPFFTLHDRISCFDLGLDDVANRSLLKKRLSVFFVAHHFDIVVKIYSQKSQILYYL